MEEKLLLVRELTSCLCALEVQLISDSDASVRHFIKQSIYTDLLRIVSVDTIRLMLKDMQPENLHILSGILELCYVVIPLRDQRFLCAGPCLCEPFSESRIRGKLHPFRLSPQAADRVVDHCRWLPVLTEESLHRFGTLLGHHVLGLPQTIPHRRIDYRWYQSGQPPVSDPEPEESRIHHIEQRYEASAALTEAVKHGNLSLAYSFVQGIQSGMRQIVRNPNPLRNAQNLCIILNTQLRHALEACGVHPYRLDKVSGDIALHIEALNTPESAGQFCSEIIRRYCELATEDKYTSLNRLARQAVMHIKAHLADNLTVKDTASILLVNANYLSGVFRRELGITFMEFLNRERTAQAAALLRHTNMQIQRIAFAVGYNNTSHFARQFARFYGCAPREYRTRGIL